MPLVFNLEAQLKVMATLWKWGPGTFSKKCEKDKIGTHNFFCIASNWKTKGTLYYETLKVGWNKAPYFPI